MSVMKRSYERRYEEDDSYTMLSVWAEHRLLGPEQHAYPL
jgi:hypothetical protein